MLLSRSVAVWHEIYILHPSAYRCLIILLIVISIDDLKRWLLTKVSNFWYLMRLNKTNQIKLRTLIISSRLINPLMHNIYVNMYSNVTNLNFFFFSNVSVLYIINNDTISRVKNIYIVNTIKLYPFKNFITPFGTLKIKHTFKKGKK